MAIQFLNSPKVGDNVKIELGTGVDLELYSNGADGYVVAPVDDLVLQAADDVFIYTQGGEDAIIAKGNGAVELYNNNNKRFETTAGGTLNTGTIDSTGTITVTGANGNVGINTDTGKLLLGASYDLQIYHDATNSYIDNQTGNLFIVNKANDKDIRFQTDNGAGGTTTYFTIDGLNGINQFSKNVSLPDNVIAKFGNSSDLQIYHDNSNSYIQDTGTGNLLITSGGASVQINKGTTENMAEFITDGAVKLYYNSVKKFETTSTGVQIGTLTSGATAQLVVNHEGGSTAIASFKARTNRAQVSIADNDTTGYLVAEGSVFSIGRIGSLSANNINIASSNNVGIGTTAPGAKLEVTGNIDDNWAGRFENTNAGGYGVLAKIAGTSANERIFEARVGTSTKVLISGDGNTTFSGNVDVAINTSGNNVISTFKNANTTAGNRSAIKVEQQVNATGSFSAFLGSTIGGKVFLSNDSITANHLVIDTSGNVGIGTDSPNSFSGQRSLTINGTDNSRLDLQVAGSNKGEVSTSAGALFLIHNTGDIRFQPGGTFKMIVKSSGNVGIGTTGPQELLHVKASNTTATVEIQGGLDTITAIDQVQAEINFGANDASATGGIAGSIKSITEVSNGAHNGIAFYTGRQSRDPYLQRAMQIRSTGGISFGSGSASHGSSGQILKSNGDASPTWVNPSTVIGGPYLPLGGGTMTGATLHGDSVLSRYGADNDFSIYHDGTNGYLQNETGNLLIPSGNVGIGTTSPQGKVHISDTSTQLVLETPNATNDIDFRFRENGSNKWNFRYQNSSNALEFINQTGTTFIQLSLKADGSSLFGGNVTVGGGQILTPSGVNLALNPNTGVVNVGGVIRASGTGNSYFTGNLGIGDTSPSYPLVVSKASASTSNGDDSSIRLTLTNTNTTANNYSLILFNDGTSEAGSGAMGFQYTDHTNNYGDLCFITRGAAGYKEKVRIKSDGSILQQGPAVGGTNTHYTWQYGNDSNFRLDLKQNVGAGIVKHIFDLTNSGTSYANNLVLDRGKVGIGTSAPSFPLEVNGGTGDGIKIKAGNSSNDDSFLIANNVNSTLFLVDGNGSVGIGTSSPDVSGASASSTVLSVIETVGNRRGILELGDNQNADTGGIGSINFVGTYQNAGHKVMAEIRASGSGATSGQRGSFISMFTKANGTAAISERIRIKSTGQIQFNAYGLENFTGNVAYQLAVDSSGNIIEIGASDLPGGPYLPLSGGTLTGSLTVKAKGSQLSSSGYYINSQFSDVIGGANVGVIIAHNDTTNGLGAVAGINGLAFLTFGTSWAERMRITSAGNVGIGTTAPSVKFQVAGSSKLGGPVYVSSDGNFNTSATYTFRDAVFINNPNDTSATSSSNSVMSIGGMSGNSVKTSLITTGAIGIGTASPLAKLHLSDTTGGTIYIEDSDGTATHNVTSISNSGNNLTLDTRRSTGTFVSTDYQIAKNASGADYHRWFTQGSERIRLNSAGNVGIGNTSPAKKLEISSGTSGDGILLTGTGSFATGASRNIEFSYSDTDTSYASAIKFEVKDASVHGGQIGFFTDAGPSSSSSLGASIRAMTIDPSQNVGIGITAPTSRLSLSGSQTALDLTRGTTGDSKWGLSSDSTALYIAELSTGSTDYIMTFKETSGNVGIGATAPTGKLEIQRSQVTTQFDRDSFLRLHPSATTNSGGFTNIFFGTSTTNNFGVAVGGRRGGTGDTSSNNNPEFSVRILNDAITGTEVLNINTAGDATFAGNIVFGDNHFIGNGSGDNLSIQSSTGEDIVLDASGDIVLDADDRDITFKDGGVNFATFNSNSGSTFSGRVGIGGTNPGDRELYVTGGAAILEIESTTDNQNASVWFRSKVSGASDDRWELGTNITQTSSFELYNRNTGISAFNVNSSNNATFTGDVSVEDNLYLTDGGTTRAKIQLNASDKDDLDIKAVSLGSNMKFFTVDTERMRITSLGDIRFTGNSHTPYIQLVNSGRTAGNPGFSFNNDTNTGMFQPSGAADTISFSTGGTERIRITSTGNVGIGTTNPADVLGINVPSGTTKGIYFQDSGTTTHGTIIQYVESSNLFQIKQEENNVQTGILTIKRSNGSVGIGTVNPTVPLHVEGTIKGIKLEMDASGSSASDLGSATGFIDIIVGGNAYIIPFFTAE